MPSTRIAHQPLQNVQITRGPDDADDIVRVAIAYKKGAGTSIVFCGDPEDAIILFDRGLSELECRLPSGKYINKRKPSVK